MNISFWPSTRMADRNDYALLEKALAAKIILGFVVTIVFATIAGKFTANLVIPILICFFEFATIQTIAALITRTPLTRWAFAVPCAVWILFVTRDLIEKAVGDECTYPIPFVRGNTGLEMYLREGVLEELIKLLPALLPTLSKKDLSISQIVYYLIIASSTLALLDNLSFALTVSSYLADPDMYKTVFNSFLPPAAVASVNPISYLVIHRIGWVAGTQIIFTLTGAVLLAYLASKTTSRLIIPIILSLSMLMHGSYSFLLFKSIERQSTIYSDLSYVFPMIGSIALVVLFLLLSRTTSVTKKIEIPRSKTIMKPKIPRTIQPKIEPAQADNVVMVV